MLESREWRESVNIFPPPLSGAANLPDPSSPERGLAHEIRSRGPPQHSNVETIDGDSDDAPEPLEMLGPDVGPDDVIINFDDDDEQPAGTDSELAEMRRLRAQQDAEYQASLAVDRERERERRDAQAAAERERQEQVTAEAGLQEALAARRNMASAALSALPPVNPLNRYRVAFMLPTTQGGRRWEMSFSPSHPITALWRAVESREETPWRYRLVAGLPEEVGAETVMDYFNRIGCRAVMVRVEEGDERPPPPSAVPQQPGPPSSSSSDSSSDITLRPEGGCGVCFDRKAVILLKECWHLIFCEICYDEFKTFTPLSRQHCPLCRTPIVTTQKIFC
ncbi:Putative apoptosis inhibitor [Frankliniella fusca]|uniref:Apoptosis inhibitor n=1 Tax=Frankliniella fusca TaxID=407009 RepID=A0AAE1HBG2_9NEOP|nr:Putative apoptosis inhibitor [Frankliniella fusca]